MVNLFSIHSFYVPLFIFLSVQSVNVHADERLLDRQMAIMTKNPEGFSAALGLKLASTADYDGSDEYTLALQLEGAVYWKQEGQVLYWEGLDLNDTELGWRYLKQDSWLFDTGIRHETVLPTSQTQAAGIDNFPHRGSHLFAFIETKHTFNDNESNWMSARVSAGPSSYGWLAKTAVGHTFDFGVIDDNKIKGNIATDISLFTTFASADHLNNYFGITQADETASGLSQIQLDSGYRSSGLLLSYRRNVSEKIQLAAEAGAEFYASDIKQSDLVSNGAQTNLNLSLFWLF